MRYLSIMTRWRRCKNVSDRVYYSFSVRSAGWNPQAVQLKILHHAPRFAGVLFFCFYPGEGVPISYTSTAGGSAGGVFFWWGVPWLGLPLWAVLVAWCVLWLFVLLCALCLSFFGAFLSGCVSCMAWGFSGCLRLAVDALRDTPGGGSTAALLRRGSASSSRKIEKGHILNRFFC